MGNKIIYREHLYVKHLQRNIYIVEPSSLRDYYEEFYINKEREYLEEYLKRINRATEKLRESLPKEIYNVYYSKTQEYTQNLKPYFKQFETWYNDLIVSAKKDRNNQINNYVSLWKKEYSAKTDDNMKKMINDDIRKLEYNRSFERNHDII